MPSIHESDSEVFHEVLGEAIEGLEQSGVHYVLMGGVAATAHGGRRRTHDIDVFVKPGDASKVLAALAAHDFQTETTDPRWLFKAFKRDVMVDIIFKSSGNVYLDDVMYERARVEDVFGRKIRVIAPEDLLVIKALVLNEHSLSLDDHCMRHLNDFLNIVRSRQLDWDYVLMRARLGPKRVLSLLLYAQSMDLMVPNGVIKSLAGMLEIC